MALILILPSSTRLATSTHNRCVWHTILDQFFPINAGYIVRDEAPRKYGGSDIGVYEHRLNARKRHVFLIIQCERARHQAKPAKWTQAEFQLQRSLSTVHGKKKVGQRSPVYGAVAMGRKIKIFKYVDRTRNISPWRPAPWSNAKDLVIPDIARSIETALNYIANHH